ncbi:MAG: site-2 protease family protein [Bacteroidia bacterium]|nr:site-2 protease family protein [Bacteroidia bacterium]MCX7764591.1 site-2 protease family protein [Bacteroidia bacterium]MDW8056826.1 site-2 protease family protein [Bacteroidia bacterium]
MSRFTLRIATVAGIPIYLHWSFWLLILWVLISSFSFGANAVSLILWRLSLMGGLVVSVILHELGHALTAKALGIPTRDITMYPFGGVASVSRIPDKPLQELAIALAGPLVNFLLIGVFSVVLILAGESPEWAPDVLIYEGEGMPSLKAWLISLSFLNGILAIFNLLPAFPMDGGRVLRALLAVKLPYIQATRIAALIGQGFAVIFILIGIYQNPFLILIGFFVFVAAAQEREHTEQRTAMQGLTVAHALLREVPTLYATQALDDAIRSLLNSQARSFLIIDPLGLPAGSLSREQIIEALNEGRSRQSPLAQVMDTELLIVPPTMPLHEAFQMLNEKHKPFLVVAEGSKVLGIIDAENIAEYLLIRQAEGMAPRL